MNTILPHENTYSKESNTLHCNWNYGFFSNCSVTLWGLIDLYNTHIMPDHIDFSGGFSYYRSKSQIKDRTDLYNIFFATDTDLDIEYSGVISKHDHHGIYGNYDYENYGRFIRKYFRPSKAIDLLQNQLSKAYNICFEETIVVYYRGTDKQIEVDCADPSHYLAATENILKTAPESRILIQTDQQQVRDMYLKHFGHRCFYFHELPVTKSNTGIHVSLAESRVKSHDFAMLFLAVTGLMSKCKHILVHKGNVPAWICLLRGHAVGVTQIDPEELLYPVRRSYHIQR